jgi:uncharacterized lipoprotein NlpE involved in copper resistance
MKTKIFSLTIMAICLFFSCNSGKQPTTVMTVDSSKTSVDWVGAYSGTVPCADCEGIFTTLTLHENSTFQMTMSYLGKEFEVTSEGNFTWDEQGNIITLEKEDEGMKMFKVGENKIFMLDVSGKEITGELANNYILVKE